MSADSITLSIPHEKPFHSVARLVVGGLAARLDLSYEHLEDLQLALASVLERDGYISGREVKVRLDVGPDSIGMLIGPLDPNELRADLEREGEEGVPLSRLLDTLVDEMGLEEGEGGHWLRLDKKVPMTKPEPKGEL
ncbi:MAG TPA: hypothetical protein VFG85_09515 [Gaiellaceae bacterium]|nr:hypothetical protein [Gaiellaceae bacterium]